MASIDPVSLGVWFDAYGPSLVLYARQFVAPGSAEDVVQDVFVRLMAQRGRPENVKAWLFQSVRNAAVSWIRSRRRRAKYERAAGAARCELFRAAADDLIDAQAARKALQSLVRQEREIVVLRIWGGMTHKEIAEIVSLPVTTVFRRYGSALASIRKAMVSSCETKKN